MKSSLYIFKENEVIHRSFRSYFPSRKKLTLRDLPIFRKSQKYTKCFFPNINQWAGLINLNHQYQRSCHRKPVLKRNTTNSGTYCTLTKCSIDSLVALWAFHHRTISMVSWKKKKQSVKYWKFICLQSLTAKLLYNYI